METKKINKLKMYNLKSRDIVAIANIMPGCSFVAIKKEKDKDFINISLSNLIVKLKPFSRFLLSVQESRKRKRIARAEKRKDFLNKIFQFDLIKYLLFKNENFLKIECRHCRNAIYSYSIYHNSFANYDMNKFIKCKMHAAIQSIVDCLSNPNYNRHLRLENGVYFTCRHCIEFKVVNGISFLILDEKWIFNSIQIEYQTILKAIWNH